MTPAVTLVKTFIQTGIGACQQMEIVLGVNPEGMVVTVFLTAGTQDGNMLTPVTGDPHEHVHLVNKIGRLR